MSWVRAYINLSASVLVRGTLGELGSAERQKRPPQTIFLNSIKKNKIKYNFTEAFKTRNSKIKQTKKTRLTPCLYFHRFFFLTSSG